MKICPTCNTEYDNTTKFCLEDGTRTVDKDQKTKDPIIGQFVDKDRQYQVTSLLGEGGMGKVYKGRQEVMGRDVAIKTLHKELLDKEQIAKRFRREALAAAKLKHQHGIDVFAFGQIDATGQPYDGMPYMVMEFVSGRSLYKAIHDANKLSESRSIHIMLQVCDVLEEAHTLGIIHRDLKPENIVLTKRGKNKDFVKVLDFGIAKLLQEEEAGATKLTKAGTVFGTPEYLSPEQASGTPVDARSDLYSLGIILYEMLTGKVPFHADTAVGLLIKHVNETPVPIREFDPSADISEGMESIIMRALSKDPKDRQQSVTELANTLRALRDGKAIPKARVVAPTVVPGGPPPGLVSSTPPTMMADGPPSLLQKPSVPTTNPPMVAPAVVPSKNAAPAVQPLHVTPSPQTLQPMVVNQNTSTNSGSVVWAIILLAVLLGGGGAGAYFLFFTDKSTPVASLSSEIQDPTATAQTPPETPENTPSTQVNPITTPPEVVAQKVKLTFSTSPTGVEVLYNGILIGVTPLEYKVDSSKTPVTITLQKDGFITVAKNIIPDQEQTIPVKLTEAKGLTSTTSDSGKKTGGKKTGGKKTGGKKTTPEDTSKTPKPTDVYNILDKRLGNDK